MTVITFLKKTKVNNRERFLFSKEHGLTEQSAEDRVEKLVSILINALYIPVEDGEVLTRVDPARIEHFEIDRTEPINFGDLHCAHVEDKGDYFEVTIEEAAPMSCPTLCAYIEKYMAAYGWPIVVVTEW